MVWTVPYTNDQDNFIKTLQVDRTICLLKNDMKDPENFPEFIMELSTESVTGFIFILQWEFVLNYFSVISNTFSEPITVGNGSPKFYYIDLKDVEGALKITVTSSNNNHCGTISTHPLVCPITNSYGVHRKPITNNATIYIKENEYRQSEGIEKGFFLMLSSFASNCQCDPDECNYKGLNTPDEAVKKSFTFKIDKITTETTENPNSGESTSTEDTNQNIDKNSCTKTENNPYKIMFFILLVILFGFILYHFWSDIKDLLMKMQKN